MLEIERGSTRPHCVENSLAKRLWTCHKTDHGLKCAECRGTAKILIFILDVPGLNLGTLLD
jgi:hypothetical protein